MHCTTPVPQIHQLSTHRTTPQETKRSRSSSPFLNSGFEVTRESGLVRLVGLSAFGPKQIVQPGTVGFQLLATAAVHHSEVHPGCGVSNSSDFVTNVCPRVLAHLLVEVLIGEQVVEVLGDLVVITRRAEVPALAVDNLERDTAGSGSDHGDTSVEGLGDLDLETFASGKLKGDVGVIQ